MKSSTSAQNVLKSSFAARLHALQITVRRLDGRRRGEHLRRGGERQRRRGGRGLFLKHHGRGLRGKYFE